MLVQHPGTRSPKGKLGEEINNLRQKSGSTQTEISLTNLNLDRVLRNGYKNIKIQIVKVEQQQKKTRKKKLLKQFKKRETSKKELDEQGQKSRRNSQKLCFLHVKNQKKKFSLPKLIQLTLIYVCSIQSYETSGTTTQPASIKHGKTKQTAVCKQLPISNPTIGYEQPFENKSKNKSKMQKQPSA